MESFEEEAITTSSYKPRIWKCYVDDTFTILDCENVVDFLQQHNQHPFTCFTMETEKDNNLTQVYRKPTHTNQHLVHDSHHPQSVKHSIVKCLYKHAKHLDHLRMKSCQ